MNLQDKIVVFRDHFKMAKVGEVDFSNRNDLERQVLEEFYGIVVDACEQALESLSPSFRIYGATKTQAIGEEFWRCRSATHRMVEITESRLIGVKVLGGLSLNEINRHYDYERDCSKPFCFVWNVPIDQIENPLPIPSYESIRLEHELCDCKNRT